MTRKMWRHRVTSAGQISIPAEVRERWGARTVAIEDEGDRIVLRPVPDDPVDAYRGVLRGKGRDISSHEAVRIVDESDKRAEERKWGKQSSSTPSR